MDKREAILERLFTVLAGLDGFASIWRNRAELKEDKRPALVMLDGSEAVQLAQARNGRGQPAGVAQSLLYVKPQIFVLLKSQKPENATVGQLLNQYRRSIILAVAQDDALTAMVAGSVEYDGCETDMQTGSTVQGEMQLHFSFPYAFKLSELAQET